MEVGVAVCDDRSGFQSVAPAEVPEGRSVEWPREKSGMARNIHEPPGRLLCDQEFLTAKAVHALQLNSFTLIGQCNA
jgi:hypothetical protein